jgi:hypothetical protein
MDESVPDDLPEEYRAAKLQLREDEGFVGDTLQFKATNLPADETIRVTWNSVRGTWGVRRSNKVLGPQFNRRQETIATKQVGRERQFEDSWTVDENHGGDHILELWVDDEVKLDTATFTIKPHFELDRETAQVGERFRLTGYGLGTDRISSNYQVTWDNGYVGFVTGMTNRGTGTAEIRAAGPPGEHVIQIWRNYEAVPFVQNYTQSPGGELAGGRQTVWNVAVTPPETPPAVAEMEAMYDEDPVPAHIPDVDEDLGAELAVEPSSGKPGTDAIVTGREFPPETEVDLVWYTQGGERTTGDPVRTEPRPDVLPTVETDADGSFQVDFTVPYDTGATRPVLAEVDGRSVAATGFMLQPDVVDISPREGPVGTEITVEVAGLGWPLYENTYYVLYDNKPLGYVVSNVTGEDGVVRFELQATGHEGYHFIDMVPSFNDTEVEKFDLDHKPHLSYLDNHPQRAMPGMHFAFEVTGE